MCVDRILLYVDGSVRALIYVPPTIDHYALEGHIYDDELFCVGHFAVSRG